MHQTASCARTWLAVVDGRRHMTYRKIASEKREVAAKATTMAHGSYPSCSTVLEGDGCSRASDSTLYSSTIHRRSPWTREGPRDPVPWQARRHNNAPALDRHAARGGVASIAPCGCCLLPVPVCCVCRTACYRHCMCSMPVGESRGRANATDRPRHCAAQPSSRQMMDPIPLPLLYYHSRVSALVDLPGPS